MSDAPAAAYLVIRDGGAWRDLYRLDPRAVTTLGRAPDNRIVLHDDRASRRHAEVTCTGGAWSLRDLDSRNGTRVSRGGERLDVTGEVRLEEGDVVRVGDSELGFTRDLSAPLDRFGGAADGEPDGLDSETRGGSRSDPEVEQPPRILGRRRENALADSAAGGGDRRLGALYRLALRFGAAADQAETCEAALGVLLDHTPADIAAVLLLGPDDGTPAVRRLNVAAYRGRRDSTYRLVSDSLSSAALDSGEAVLAEAVAADDRLAGRDSLGRLRAESVVCAPIRPPAPGADEPGGADAADRRRLGLVHLYSQDPGNPLDEADLEFTLAVAEQLAGALDGLQRRGELEADLSKAERTNRSLRQTLGAESAIVGDSPAVRALREDIAHIAPSDATVLVRGESGVGKELVARALHLRGRRADGPFVTMNCAALTETLLESELFGHEAGSFTGATGRKVGKFEAADAGTLFLDEVGEMSPAIQAKFLRVLEGHPFERVGGRQTVHVDVRVVAATNRDLEAAVADGDFRRDLYYRLHVVVLEVEPLRNRPGDVERLADFFLERSAASAGRRVKGFTDAARDALTAYGFPGNVRELKNAVERAVVLCRGDRIGPEDLRLTPPGGDPGGAAGGASGAATPGVGFRAVSLEVLEREQILATLAHTDWNKSQAAGILGIERSTLDRKLKKYGVSRPDG